MMRKFALIKPTQVGCVWSVETSFWSSAIKALPYWVDQQAIWKP